VTITIPGTIGEVADSSFSYCTRLQSVIIEEGITDIRDRGFGGCAQLASVSLPNTLRTIGGYAFESANALAYVWIPDSVVQMGASALPSDLVNASIPGNVDMQANPFAYCNRLLEIHLRDRPVQSVCYALASTPGTAIFVSQRSGLSPGDTVCNGRNITIEPDVVSPSFMPSRSKLPTQSAAGSRSEFPTRSPYSRPRPPTASPGSIDGGTVAAIVVPIVIVVLLAVVGGILFWRRRSYAKLDNSSKEPLTLQSDGAVVVEF
jgi:hypothetical protein